MQFEQKGKLIYFENLDNSPHLQGVLAVGFRFKDDGSEAWTARFNRFKAKDPTAVKAGARVLGAAIKSVEFTKKPPVLIASALPSQEKFLSQGHPLAHLGIALAGSVNCTFDPTILNQTPHARLHNVYIAADRDAIVDGVHFCTAGAGKVLRKVNTVLLVDDLTTRGSTLNDAARALRAVKPDLTIYGVVLAKNDTVGYWQNTSTPISNAHIPGDLAKLWDSTK